MARENFPATLSSSTDVASTGKETDSQLQRGFDRRSLLKGLGVVGVAVSAGSLLAPEEAHASGGPSPRDPPPLPLFAPARNPPRGLFAPHTQHPRNPNH